uniref:Putative secreted protein n=1 Tax=Anopheles darlingi TaxID=43151 RepID=A0A2M4D067_ANODA
MMATVLLRYLMQLHVGITIRVRDCDLRQLIVGHRTIPGVTALFRGHLIVTVHGSGPRSCRRLSVISSATGGLSSHRYRRRSTITCFSLFLSAYQAISLCNPSSISSMRRQSTPGFDSSQLSPVLLFKCPVSKPGGPRLTIHGAQYRFVEPH